MKYLSSKDVAEILHVTERTARNYMRKMIHTEKPLRVTEASIEAWMNNRTYEPSGVIANTAKYGWSPDSSTARIPRRHGSGQKKAAQG